MSKINLEEHVRLDAAATPAPWYELDFDVVDENNEPICNMESATLLLEDEDGNYLGDRDCTQANAALIATMRNDHAAMIAKLRAADALRDVIRVVRIWDAEANPQLVQAFVDALAAYDALEVTE